MARLKIDQLNEHSKESSKVIPIKKYFQEMEVDDYGKETRILIAEEISYIIALALSMIRADKKIGNPIMDVFYNAFIMARIADVLAKFDIKEIVRDIVLKEVSDIVNDLINATLEEEKPRVYTDTEMAVRVSEDTTNIIVGINEYAVAVASGKKWKTWKSMKDNRVRKSHMMVDNTRIPIDKLFVVGKSEMMYPMDLQNGAGLEEIIGCRCSCIYS